MPGVPNPTAVDRLAHFGALVALAHHRDGEVDDLELQNFALASGVLCWVVATEPCGTDCVCARVAKLPQDCLRAPEDVADLIQELSTPPRIPSTTPLTGEG